MTKDAAHDLVNIDAALCDGCGVCVDSCPTDVFRIDRETGRCRAVYPKDCHVCFLCQDDCPTNAITISYDISNTLFQSIYDIMGIQVTKFSGDKEK